MLHAAELYQAVAGMCMAKPPHGPSTGFAFAPRYSPISVPSSIFLTAQRPQPFIPMSLTLPGRRCQKVGRPNLNVAGLAPQIGILAHSMCRSCKSSAITELPECKPRVSACVGVQDRVPACGQQATNLVLAYFRSWRRLFWHSAPERQQPWRHSMFKSLLRQLSPQLVPSCHSQTSCRAQD